MAPTKMTLEPVSAFNGLDVLVARDEGLFEAEGLDVQFAFLWREHCASRLVPSPR